MNPGTVACDCPKPQFGPQVARERSSGRGEWRASAEYTPITLMEDSQGHACQPQHDIVSDVVFWSAAKTSMAVYRISVRPQVPGVTGLGLTRPTSYSS